MAHGNEYLSLQNYALNLALVPRAVVAVLGGDRIETGCMVLMLDTSSVTFCGRYCDQLAFEGYQLGYEMN